MEPMRKDIDLNSPNNGWIGIKTSYFKNKTINSLFKNDSEITISTPCNKEEFLFTRKTFPNKTLRCSCNRKDHFIVKYEVNKKGLQNIVRKTDEVIFNKKNNNILVISNKFSDVHVEAVNTFDNFYIILNHKKTNKDNIRLEKLHEDVSNRCNFSTLGNNISNKKLKDMISKNMSIGE